MNEQERWQQIKGFEGLYDVSDQGRVFTYYSNKVLSPGKIKTGYLTVILYKNGKRFAKKVHRLVAEAFIGNPEGYLLINHIDEDKTNNVVSNLEWCSAQFNTEYSQAHYYIFYDENDDRVEIFNLNKFAKDRGMHIQGFDRVVKGKEKSYMGYTRQPGIKLNRKGSFNLISPKGEIVTFNNGKEAAKHIKAPTGNIAKFLKGKLKSCKGWTLPE